MIQLYYIPFRQKINRFIVNINKNCINERIRGDFLEKLHKEKSKKCIPLKNDISIGAIVSEFNPFHNGHKYCIEKLRENGASHIMCIMSGCFVQRGEPACLTPYARAEMAIECGADLVVELPVVYSLSSAENFAFGAVSIAELSGCVKFLGFGSECTREELETHLEKITYTTKNYPDIIEEKMKSGMSYPSALQKSVEEIIGYSVSNFLSDGNNILAMNYIMSLDKLGSQIKPVFIKRKGSSHDSPEKDSGGKASASYIRNLIYNKNESDILKKYIPPPAYEIFMREKNKGLLFSEGIEQALLYKLRMSDISDFENINEIGNQGLAQRMFSAKDSAGIDDFLAEVKTKRYPMARIKRHILNLALEINHETARISPQYGRILAFNQKGTEILKKIKATSSIPFSTSLAKLEQTNSNARILASKDSASYRLYTLGFEKKLKGSMAYSQKISLKQNMEFENGNQ